MFKMKIILFLFAFYASSALFAQDKFEKESRIKRKYVPAQALKFIDSLNLQSSVKWYQEEGMNHKSIEAKFRISKARYSVEFDSLGRIEDIEVEVAWGQLELSMRESIENELKPSCLNHKIVKVQRQFTGSERDLYHLLKSGSISSQLQTKYEVIVRCKQENQIDLYEYLFSDSGKTLSISKMVFKNSSHLEY